MCRQAGEFICRCTIQLQGMHFSTQTQWQLKAASAVVPAARSHPPLPVVLAVVVHLCQHGVVHGHVAANWCRGGSTLDAWHRPCRMQQLGSSSCSTAQCISAYKPSLMLQQVTEQAQGSSASLAAGRALVVGQA